MVINLPVLLIQESPLVRSYDTPSLLSITTTIGIEAQLLSEADIERGVNVSFPMNDSNISVQSEVPNPTISKNTF